VVALSRMTSNLVLNRMTLDNISLRRMKLRRTINKVFSLHLTKH
jgi:hypothetical protein